MPLADLNTSSYQIPELNSRIELMAAWREELPHANANRNSRGSVIPPHCSGEVFYEFAKSEMPTRLLRSYTGTRFAFEGSGA